jgi:hypothetical protein
VGLLNKPRRRSDAECTLGPPFLDIRQAVPQDDSEAELTSSGRAIDPSAQDPVPRSGNSVGVTKCQPVYSLERAAWLELRHDPCRTGRDHNGAIKSGLFASASSSAVDISAGARHAPTMFRAQAPALRGQVKVTRLGLKREEFARSPERAACLRASASHAGPGFGVGRRRCCVRWGRLRLCR